MSSTLLIAALCVVFGFGMAILSFKFIDHIIVFGTSTIGAYAFVRGLSFFVGNFPNEIEFVKNIIQGKSQEVGW